MALTLEELVIELAAEAGNYAKQLDQVNKDTKGWADNLAGSASKLLGGVMVGAAGAAAGAVAAISGAAFAVSKDTEVAAANMAAQLDIPVEKAMKFADIARDVYGNNFSGSVIEAGDVVAEAYRRMGDVGEEQLQRISEQAFAMADNFGAGPNETLSAAQTLMDEFGLTSDQAFDFIAKGFQRGLNRSDDFLDTIGEYSNLFGDAGFDASAFFSIMETGAAGGVLGTDKIADAVKEMGIILNEGTDDARAAFALMGMDFDEIAGYVRSGDEAWADYFPSIIAGLNGIENPMLRSQAQVAIFGTMAEDLGVSFTEGLSTASTSMADMEGAADQLNAKYNTFGDMFAGIWRKAVVSVSPATDKLLELANEAMPWVEAAFDKLAEWIPPAIDFAVEAVDKGVAFISGLFEGPLGDGIDAGVSAFQTVQDWIDENMPLIQRTIETVLGAITGFWEEHGDMIMTVVRNFMSIVETLIDTYLKNALDIVKAVMQLITGDFEGAEETLLGIVDRTWSAVLDIIGTIIENVQTVIEDVDWGELGRNVIEGIANGVKFAAHLLVEAVEHSAGWAVEGVKRLLGIASPSKVMADEVGAPIIAGLVQGIERNGQNVVSAAESIIADTLYAMDVAGNIDTQFGMFGDVFLGSSLESYLSMLSERVTGNLAALGGMVTPGGFVDGGNNRGGSSMPNNITINVYSNDPTKAGDSVVQSLRAYGLAA